MIKIETYKGIVRVHRPSIDGGTGDEFELVKDHPMVRFPSHGLSFLMMEIYCRGPECDCNEVSLYFMEMEETGDPIANPITFSIRLNLNTWQENGKPARTGRAQCLVDEFIDNMSDDTMNRFSSGYKKTRKDARKAAELEITIDEINSGRLVSWAEIFGDEGGVSSGGKGIGFSFEYENEELYIDDLYCIQPKCTCGAVVLLFLKNDYKAEALVDVFTARFSFKDGLEIENHPLCTKDEAETIFNVWMEYDLEAINVMMGRYRRVKEIGRTLIAKGDVSKNRSKCSIRDARKEKVGRNSPCPCGSGKKYKRCCGKQ
jgi:uncharacterized protein YchJ